MSNPTARTLARRVAQELGQPTNHPGTNRLARDLADALTRPIDPAPHDPEPFDECTGPMPTADEPRPHAFSCSSTRALGGPGISGVCWCGK